MNNVTDLTLFHLELFVTEQCPRGNVPNGTVFQTEQFQTEQCDETHTFPAGEALCSI